MTLQDDIEAIHKLYNECQYSSVLHDAVSIIRRLEEAVNVARVVIKTHSEHEAIYKDNIKVMGELLSDWYAFYTESDRTIDEKELLSRTADYY
jgi:hypothetical protein